MRHIISHRYDGKIQVTMTDDTGKPVSFTVSMSALMEGAKAAADPVNADRRGALDELRGRVSPTDREGMKRAAPKGGPFGSDPGPRVAASTFIVLGERVSGFSFPWRTGAVFWRTTLNGIND